jgi:putative transcriptional regulator
VTLSPDGHLPPHFTFADLDGLDAAGEAQVRAHAASCARCGEALWLAEESFALLAAAEAPVAPPAALWDRLSRSLELDARLAPLVLQAAALLEVPAGKARRALARIDSGEGWLEGPAPLCWYQEVERGDRARPVLAALVKVKPGASFPQHRHLGRERTLVLQGAYRTGEGALFRAGELHEMARGSSHELTAEPGNDLYYLAVVDEGVEVGGKVLRPCT